MKMWRNKLTVMSSFLVSLIAILAISAPVAITAVKAQSAQLSEVVQGSKAEHLDACVRETPDMRRNHMSYLKHKRDLTMHEGIRTPDLSLNECIACHAGKDSSGNYVSVNDEGQFCRSCHERVGEKVDCFQCHRTTPETH